ncbi:MAG: Bax inhibitor-1/YccA family protein [Oenococcus sp.]|uniref:Bax inhibitor-1/YccA family protein n=1 Tax=Oenococcus TaxID=46254 RepID=UPI0021E782BE|nr:Bax inhibitor-1/YccA family protein [Oenococcus kitaharae]MCV3296082.1 Bax inhibitor-1/YccA family protein [Oenococcus kitaharae]
MQNFSNNRVLKDVTDSTRQAGLAAFFQRTYAYMGGALLITFGLAYLLAYPLASQIANFYQNSGMLTWIILAIAQFAVVIMIGRNALKNPALALAGLLVYAVIEGLFFGVIFAVTSLSSIVSAFLVAAVDFGAMSLYGFITKKNLASWAPIMFGALIALFVGLIISIFVPGFSLIISVLGILVFSAYAAYDNNRLKQMYFQLQGQGNETTNGLAIAGALNLYLDFINLFLFLLRLFGNQRN